MPALPPDLLHRVSQALRRGEFLYVDETALALPVVAEPPAPDHAWDGGLLELLGPPTQFVVGALVLTPDAAYRELDGPWETQPLPGAGTVRVEYGGHAASPYTRPRYGREWQLLNRVQVGRWPAHGVLLRQAAEEQKLIRLLQSWYERRVPVREVYAGQRTFLLNPRMSYEEIQAFKRRYGVSLY